MPKRLDAKGVRRHWDKNVKTHGLSHAASWTDLPMIEREAREISQRLADGDRVLDVGCGNGFTTVRLAIERDIHVRGVDFIPGMIKNAQKRLGRGSPLARRVTFAVGDVTSLKEEDAAYDKVVSVRVLINLVRHSDQKRALQECARVLKSGGQFLLSEAMLEGWQRLNRFRKEWGLEEIPMPPFNHYLEEKALLGMTSPYFRLVESVNFSSTYYVGTRLLKPVLMKALKSKKDAADPLMQWNRWFSALPAWGEYGTQKLFVFEKK